MSSNQIQQMIQQEMHKYSQLNRFNVSNTQRHIHNNIDSPYTFQPILTYIGNISENGSVGLLPTGWSATSDEAGSYTVTHNLGTVLYACVASSSDSGAIANPVVSHFANEVDFVWFQELGKTTTNFNFILTVINNKIQTLPTYYGGLVN